MILRSPRLESLFGCRLDDSMSATAVRQVVGQAVREAQDLEFKGQLYRREDLELAKDVAAMANTLGGVIVLGVKEQHEVAIDAPGVELAASHVQSMRAMVGARVRPFPSFEILSLAGDAPEHGFYVIVVAPSAAAPFLVQTGSSDRPAFSYPRRRGSDTVWLGEFEMAIAYRDRSLYAAQQRERLSQVFDEFRRLLRSDSAWLVLTLVPDLAGEFRLTSSNVTELLQWWFAKRLQIARRPRYGPEAITRTAFRRVQLTTDLSNTLPFDQETLECHVDGASAAAMPLSCVSQPPTLSEWEVADELLTALEMTAGFASEFALCAGSCVVELRLVAPSADDGLPTRLRMLPAGRPDLPIIPYPDVVGSIPPIVTSTTLDELQDHSRLGRVARHLLADFVTAFGHNEPKAIDEDGHPWADAWPAQFGPRVRAWMGADV